MDFNRIVTCRNDNGKIEVVNYIKRDDNKFFHKQIEKRNNIIFMRMKKRVLY